MKIPGKTVWEHMKRFHTGTVSTPATPWMQREVAGYDFVQVDFPLSKIHLRGWEPSHPLPEDDDEKWAIIYSKKPTEAPLIVIKENGEIIDGRHRSRAAFLKGDKTVPAYVRQGVLASVLAATKSKKASANIDPRFRLPGEEFDLSGLNYIWMSDYQGQPKMHELETLAPSQVDVYRNPELSWDEYPVLGSILFDDEDERMLWFREPHLHALPKIPGMTSAQAKIAFEELGKNTSVKNGADGVEYLLYRGVDKSHLKEITNNVFKSSYRSSWTPIKRIAEHFAKDRLHEGFVIEGWVPRSKIVMIPKHFWKSASKHEYEVVVESNTPISVQSIKEVAVYPGNEKVVEGPRVDNVANDDAYQMTAKIPPEATSVKAAVEDIPDSVIEFFHAWDEYAWDAAEGLLRNKDIQQWLQSHFKADGVVAYRGLHIHPEMTDSWKQKGFKLGLGEAFKYSDSRHTSWSTDPETAKLFSSMGEDDEFRIVLKTRLNKDQQLLNIGALPEDFVSDFDKLEKTNISRMQDESEIIALPGAFDVEVVFSSQRKDRLTALASLNSSQEKNMKAYPILNQILADSKSQWTWLDEIKAQGKAGDIVEVLDKNGKAFIVIIPEDHGFYYYPSNEKGELQTERKRGIVNHSNMFFKEEMKIVGHRPVKTHKYKEFEWYETGYEAVDRELANLDARVALFRKYAPKNLQQLYADLEDRNFHEENAEMLLEFADHLAKGGSPLWNYPDPRITAETSASPTFAEVAQAWENFKPKVPLGYIVAMRNAIRNQ